MHEKGKQEVNRPMEATAILSSDERTVFGRLQLLLRLRVVRQAYQRAGPFGETVAERARFHFTQLEQCWERATEFQRVLGLEAANFTPREQFEKIYVISAFASDEMRSPENTILDLGGAWQTYETAMRRLSHQLNPFEFGEVCLRCYRTIQDLNRPRVPPENVIPMASSSLGQFQALSRQPLRMNGT